MSKELKGSSTYKFGTLNYYHARTLELEKDRTAYSETAAYYRNELEKAHTLIGRITQQLSERWDSVRVTKHFPTDNLHNKRTITNPTGSKP